MSKALVAAGYGVLAPEGTFYLWTRWPEGDRQRMWNFLADRGVFVMPGEILNSPDHFRICLTATDDMVDRAIPAFAEAAKV